MKRTNKKLAFLAGAICLFVSVGGASKSFGESTLAGLTLWVAAVDYQKGFLPVYAKPSVNSAMVGSLERCATVTLTGLQTDSFVEISQPITGWAPADLLSQDSGTCSQAYVEPPVVVSEPPVVVSSPAAVTYGPLFWRHHRHHRHHHFGHHDGHHGGHPGGHHGGHHAGHNQGHNIGLLPGHHPGNHVRQMHALHGIGMRRR